jgi:hypothetical protein
VNLNPVHGKGYWIQHCVIKFVSDLRQVSRFLRILRFPHQYKWLPRYSWNIVESRVKHNNPNLMQIPVDDTYYLLLLKLALSTIDQTKPPNMLIIFISNRKKKDSPIYRQFYHVYIYILFFIGHEWIKLTMCPTNHKWWYHYHSS